MFLTGRKAGDSYYGDLPMPVIIAVMIILIILTIRNPRKAITYIKSFLTIVLVGWGIAFLLK
ncbi:hypothetical protein EGK65_02560 [Citrobacter farmeri]|nr:hypothetical protein EGK65_02560 [Citrobacter farmeri]